MISNRDRQACKFGTHPIFDIAGLDWLSATLTTKSTTPTGEAVAMGQVGEALWHERCACIATMPPPARALCSMLIWGNNKADYDTVLEHMHTIAQQKITPAMMPSNCQHTYADLTKRLAKMVLDLHLQNAWDLCTVKGRLYFAGVDMSDKTYAKRFLHAQHALIDALLDLSYEIGESINQYRRKLISNDA